MEAVKPLACLCLARERFVELLGPLEALMSREKSDQASIPPQAGRLHISRHHHMYLELCLAEAQLPGVRLPRWRRRNAV